MNSRTITIFAAAAVLLAAILACGPNTPQPAAAPQVITVEVTSPPAATAAPTEPPAPAATEDPCIRWDKVTPAMKGEKVCMRGLITEFNQTPKVGTRYQFSDKRGTFFLFSAKYEITNPNTGKTIGPSTCVQVTGKIQVQDSVPFINLDDLIEGVGQEVGGFLFYNDPSACN
jgi:hypothetical protein